MKCSSFFVLGESGTMTRTRLDAQQKIQDTLYNEWFRSRRVTRTFTELGFNRGKLPLDLFASMSTYYYNNRVNKMREEWDSKGVFVNWWERDVYMIGMPWVLKVRVACAGWHCVCGRARGWAGPSSRPLLATPDLCLPFTVLPFYRFTVLPFYRLPFAVCR